MIPNYSNQQDHDSEDISAALYQRSEELYQIPNTPTNVDGLIECPAIILNEVVVFPE